MSEKTRILKSFFIELIVYAVLVTIYFFFVLHFLGDWLRGLFDSSKLHYAIAALALMLGQGVLLEVTTTHLLRFIHAHTD